MDLAKAVEMTCSSDGMEQIVAHAIDHHLFYLHRARQIMIRRLLPAAESILDLGGANAPLYNLGYQHPFQNMVMVDLPPDERHELYKDVQVSSPSGSVRIHYGDMTRLDHFESASFDLVWSGQSIEHVPMDAAIRMCAAAFRLLRPGGHFCLDTPNRAITYIHTRDWHGGFIHPDHKYEYRSNELRQLVANAGFDIAAEVGVCEMPETVRTQNFHYSDFVLGNPITDNVEDAYVLYLDCVKPGAAAV